MITAVILAGGRATRMGGIDKRELVIDGRTIFERQLAVLRPRVAEILVSSPRELPDFRTVRDAIPDAGPLAGIAAGLAAARTEWLLVIAGDMPHVTGELVDAMLAARADPIDAVGIRVGGLPEPLLSLLRVATCTPAVNALVAAHRLKASRLLTDAGLRVTWIDGDPRAVSNINEPSDL